LIAHSDDWVESLAGAREPQLPAADGLDSRITQGIYNAVYLQLSRGGARGGKSDCAAGLTDAESLMSDREPVWITMVGRAGFWPVSLREKEQKPSHSAACDASTPTGGTRIAGGARFNPPDTVTTLLEGSLLLWGILHLVGMLPNVQARFPRLEQFRVRAEEDRLITAQYQTYYLICATLALSAMLTLVVISAACLWLRGPVDFDHPGWYSIPDFARAAVALMLLGRAIWIATRNALWLIRPRLFLYLPWLAYVATLTGWIVVTSQSDPTGIFFAQRAFYLADGVSPLLPVEFLLLIYYAWAWSFIRKVRLSESKQVRVPELETLGLEGEGFGNLCDTLVRATDSLMFNRTIAGWMALSFLAVIAVLIRPWEALRSVEGRLYDYGFVILFMSICLLIFLVWGRYMYMWSTLSRILRGLERTSLRRAFSRLPRSVYSWSPLWYEDAQRRAYTISSRSLECFQAIVARGGYGSDAAARLQEMTDAFRRVVTLNQLSSPTDMSTAAVARLQQIMVDTAQRLLRRHLVGSWRNKGGSDTLDEAAQSRERSGEISARAQLQLLEEEFVSLRYVGLIHYVSAQLKNLVVLLVVAFVLALVSIGSYPFLVGRLFVWTMAAVFVVFGAGIIVSFAQMARDAILSRLSGTDAGKLDLSFYLRVASFGTLPLLALLASQFPSVGRSLISWLEPALNAMH
jgi:hypothetical protein